MMNKQILTKVSFFWVAMALSVLSFTESFAEPLTKTLWIDVRSPFEHLLDNIEGDMRISHKEIVEEISKVVTDKNTDIRLYCRSGVRAGKALSLLKKAGYKNVSNIGGIDDARKERGLVQ